MVVLLLLCMHRKSIVFSTTDNNVEHVMIFSGSYGKLRGNDGMKLRGSNSDSTHFR